MEKIKLLCLTCLAAALLALVPASPAWTFDGGGDDGGFDDGGGDQDEGEDHDEGDHPDGQDHDWAGHHHDNWAGHHHHGGWGLGPGLGFGPGFGFGGFGGIGGFGGLGFMQPFYPFPYYAYPPMLAQPAQPVYIQQQNAGQSAPDSQTSFWHYCRAPEGYYPEVKDCPDGWQQIAPQAPPQPPPQPVPQAAPQLPQDNQG